MIAGCEESDIPRFVQLPFLYFIFFCMENFFSSVEYNFLDLYDFFIFFILPFFYGISDANFFLFSFIHVVN